MKRIKVGLLLLIGMVMVFSIGSAALSAVSLDRSVSAGSVLMDTSENAALKFSALPGYAKALTMHQNGTVSVDLQQVLAAGTGDNHGFNSNAQFIIGSPGAEVFSIKNNTDIPVTIMLTHTSGGLTMLGNASIDSGQTGYYYFKIETNGIPQNTSIAGTIEVRSDVVTAVPPSNLPTENAPADNSPTENAPTDNSPTDNEPADETASPPPVSAPSYQIATDSQVINITVGEIYRSFTDFTTIWMNQQQKMPIMNYTNGSTSWTGALYTGTSQTNLFSAQFWNQYFAYVNVNGFNATNSQISDFKVFFKHDSNGAILPEVAGVYFQLGGSRAIYFANGVIVSNQHYQYFIDSQTRELKAP